MKIGQAAIGFQIIAGPIFWQKITNDCQTLSPLFENPSAYAIHTICVEQ